jgi:dCMP deaminase
MRQANLTWDEFFFSMAFMAGHRSKDPSTQNGACIVDDLNIIRGIGYNDFVRGIKNSEERWERPAKYRYVYHAEANAIANANGSVRGCTLYLWSSKNYLPCENCMKSIIQNGISKVKLLGSPNETHDQYDWEIVEEMAKETGVELVFCDIDISLVIENKTLSKGESNEKERNDQLGDAKQGMQDCC